MSLISHVILDITKYKFTFIYVDDIWMLDWWHYLNLTTNSHQICFSLNLCLLDCLDGNLPHNQQIYFKQIISQIIIHLHFSVPPPPLSYTINMRKWVVYSYITYKKNKMACSSNSQLTWPIKLTFKLPDHYIWLSRAPYLLSRFFVDPQLNFSISSLSKFLNDIKPETTIQTMYV